MMDEYVTRRFLSLSRTSSEDSSRSVSSFRSSSVYPSQEEMLGSRRTVKRNKIKGAYDSVDQYLDTHFRLLRENFVSSVREGIGNYRLKKETTTLKIHQNVDIFQGINHENQKCMKVDSLNITDAEMEDIEDSKRFMNGSLLIFTKNKFKTTILAKVLHRNVEDLENKKVMIKFVRKDEETTGNNFTMAECNAFFEPYYQVLKALQGMSSTHFPMEKYILKVKNTNITQHPAYLSNSSQKYKICDSVFSLKNLSSNAQRLLKLNDAQFEAYKAALTQEFVVIQGPPGTGKTFLGLKIAETLIKNYRFWWKKSPILVISHKNHALDQFVEGMIPFTERIIRVGGQSKSEELLQYNLAYLRGDITTSLSSLTLRNNNNKNKDLTILQDALVVAMTTTYAARMRETLEDLKCPIVIVEEAAEVLESHVVAALTKNCQHLILLGDHKQLRPITASHDIETKYHLGVSLFERMVMNGIRCYQLEVQHRMRPEISNLLKPTIYPFLQDHSSTKNRPSILGVEKNVFFVDHRQPEESCKDTASKKNNHEAKFLVNLARYLILNGYQPSDIAVLATYSGQVREIEEQVRKLTDRELLRDLKILTVDSFQGQESLIVLLSLVRSSSIGFLAAENRVCVALSRAKNGFYIMGNMSLLSEQSSFWEKLEKCLQQQDSIKKYLTLKCENHPNETTIIFSPDDFKKTYSGGCNKKCHFKMPCGHKCNELCHPLDRKHETLFSCKNVCGRSVCKKHQKICSRICSKDCEPCKMCVEGRFSKSRK